MSWGKVPLTFTAPLVKQYQRGDICLAPVLNSIFSNTFCAVQSPMWEVTEETLWSLLHTWCGAIVNSTRHSYQVGPTTASGSTVSAIWAQPPVSNEGDPTWGWENISLWLRASSLARRVVTLISFEQVATMAEWERQRGWYEKPHP